MFIVNRSTENLVFTKTIMKVSWSMLKEKAVYTKEEIVKERGNYFSSCNKFFSDEILNIWKLVWELNHLVKLKVKIFHRTNIVQDYHIRTFSLSLNESI